MLRIWLLALLLTALAGLVSAGELKIDVTHKPKECSKTAKKGDQVGRAAIIKRQLQHTKTRVVA
jgi:hypothetical protein